MLWGILLVIFVIVVLPILLMVGTLEVLLNPVFGVVIILCITAIIITKIIRR